MAHTVARTPGTRADLWRRPRRRKSLSQSTAASFFVSPPKDSPLVLLAFPPGRSNSRMPSAETRAASSRKQVLESPLGLLLRRHSISLSPSLLGSACVSLCSACDCPAERDGERRQEKKDENRDFPESLVPGSEPLGLSAHAGRSALSSCSTRGRLGCSSHSVAVCYPFTVSGEPFPASSSRVSDMFSFASPLSARCLRQQACRSLSSSASLPSASVPLPSTFALSPPTRGDSGACPSGRREHWNASSLGSCSPSVGAFSPASASSSSSLGLLAFSRAFARVRATRGFSPHSQELSPFNTDSRPPLTEAPETEGPERPADEWRGGRRRSRGSPQQTKQREDEELEREAAGASEWLGDRNPLWGAAAKGEERGERRRPCNATTDDVKDAFPASSPSSSVSSETSRVPGKARKKTNKTHAAPSVLAVKWTAKAALEARNEVRATPQGTGANREEEVEEQKEEEFEKESQEGRTACSREVTRVRLLPAPSCHGGARRREKLFGGHPWVFQHEIANLEELRQVRTGALVEVGEDDGRLLGVGLLNRSASISVRLLRHARLQGRRLRLAQPHASSLSTSTPDSANAHSSSLPSPGVSSCSPSLPSISAASSFSDKSFPGLGFLLPPTPLLPCPIAEVASRLLRAIRRRRELVLSESTPLSSAFSSSSSYSVSSSGSSSAVSADAEEGRNRFSPSVLRLLKASSRARGRREGERERPGEQGDSKMETALQRTLFYRAVAGEADGLPGVEVDVFESLPEGGKTAQTIQLVRLLSVSARPLLPLVVEALEALPPSTCLAVQSLHSNKEKLAQGGAEFVTELVKGKNPCVWFEPLGLPVRPQLSTNLLLPPFAAYSPACQHLQSLCWSLTETLALQVAAPLSLLSVRAGPRAVAVVSALSRAAPREQGPKPESGTKGDGGFSRAHCGGRNAKVGERRGAKIESLVMLEEAATLADLAEETAKRNGLSEKASILFRLDIDVELEKMARSHLKFHLAYLHFPPVIKPCPTQRHGQFGSGYRPSFRGVCRALRTSLDLLHHNGILVYSMLLSKEENRDVGFDLLRSAVHAAGKKAMLLGAWGANFDQRILLSHDDLWYEHVYAVRVQ
ncbi:hypothetical protein TGDOM2_227140 [Toxoplasma gondii GAB2-2007-GAL-DOM2]|uniref:RlmI-like PUA domain-containing protein n=6 Tax=Toxoplasma gondii TaxID=5811 RepID=S7W5S2_TOXGG|nr:hypothetical protein TGGT1_227140 [Toxoplasma gondii GT1]KAF4640748.1 hypothetical protein TGRH88_046740 [Toxoplasma gondii]KFG45186.1 hypothetical protein TGDOM2_227140 [Toxoplasma gondii GAB2-2007-GAL-DOM2]